MTARFTMEMPDELLARVKNAAGDVPVNRWIRRTIEQALRDPNVENVRSSSQAKRDVKPIPKRGK